MAELPFTIVHTPNELSAEQAQQVLSVWQAHKALPDSIDPTERLQQVEGIAYTPEGEICGIFTCYEQINPQIKRRFHHIRTFVTPEYRQSRVAITMYEQVIKRLERDFVEGRQSQCIGMILELENQSMAKHLNRAVWRVFPCVYIGDNAEGNRVYVYYFEGATI